MKSVPPHFFVSLAFLLASCVATSRGSSGAYAKLICGDSFRMEVYELSGKVFAHYILRHIYTKRETVSSRRLTDSEVEGFWIRLQDAEVNAWLPEYIIKDRGEWTALGSWLLVARSDSLNVNSQGDGAFPSDDDAKKGTDVFDSKRFSKAQRAFECLEAPK